MKKIISSFDHWGPLFIFSSTTCCLYMPFYISNNNPPKQHWIIVIPIFLFLLYDLYFYKRKKEWKNEGRDLKQTIDSIRAASQYTSYFIAFIAISLSVLLSSPKTINCYHEVWQLFKDPWLKSYGFFIIVLSGLIILFVPVRYVEIQSDKIFKQNDLNEPSEQLKWHYTLVIFLEKTVITLTLYIILIITTNFIQKA